MPWAAPRPAVYTIDQLLAEPMVLNARLGHYTNFVNLLDLAALSAAATMPADALPVDITLIHRAGSDLLLAEFGERAPRTCRSERGSHSYRA